MINSNSIFCIFKFMTSINSNSAFYLIHWWLSIESGNDIFCFEQPCSEFDFRVSPSLRSLADNHFDLLVFGEMSILNQSHQVVIEIHHRLSNGFAIVMKSIDLCECVEFCRIEQEVEILKNLWHPCIVGPSFHLCFRFVIIQSTWSFNLWAFQSPTQYPATQTDVSSSPNWVLFTISDLIPRSHFNRLKCDFDSAYSATKLPLYRVWFVHVCCESSWNVSFFSLDA
jgi:hypothetical protein